MSEIILFLDFDGVLHPLPSGSQGVFCHLDRFEACLRAYPRLKVVVSSSWRETFPWDEIRSFFASDLQDRIIDKTPVLPGERRYEEVQAWLRMQDCHRPWIALDDATDEFPDACPQLCRCYTTIGFDETAERRLVTMIEDLLRVGLEAATMGKPDG